MTGWDRHLRATRIATEPRFGAVERLRTRHSWTGNLLRAAAVNPRVGALDRVRTRPRSRSLLWGLAPVALVAAATFWFALPPAALAELLYAVSPTERIFTAGLRFEYLGSGGVDGTMDAPRIRWEVGTLTVDVAPTGGVELIVETDEAHLTASDAGFTVTRNALGTTIEIGRGSVVARCDGVRENLIPGKGRACLPVRAAGWIGRAEALAAAGRPPEAVLEAIESGLRLAGQDDPARGELLAQRIRVLVDLGKYADALSAADDYLESGATSREDEVRSLAEGLRARR